MTDDQTTAQTPVPEPTEPIALADQQPAPAAAPAPQPAAAPAARTSHTRTILEVVGGVVAAALILFAGVAGFVLGHATSRDGDGDRGVRVSLERGQGQGMMPGQQGMDRRGIDPDGDNWTGGGQQGRGMMPGQQGQGMMPGLPGQQGMDPRGIDPDGDNWTGGGQQGPGMMPGLPAQPDQQGGTTPTTPQQ